MRTPWGSRGSRQPMEPGESPSSGSPSPVASGLSFLGGFLPSFFGQEQRPPGGSSDLQEERRVGGSEGHGGERGKPVGISWFPGSTGLPSTRLQGLLGCLGSGREALCDLSPLDTPLHLLGTRVAPSGPQSWPGLGLNPVSFLGSPTAPTLTSAVPTGTATRIPPASIQLTSQRPPGA